jgi:hypothetical protein
MKIVEGRRNVERPRLRLFEDADNDLRENKYIRRKESIRKTGWWRRRRTYCLLPELLHIFYNNKLCNCNGDQVESEVSWWMAL